MATNLTIAALFALEREAAPFRRAARALSHVSIHVSGVGRERAQRAAASVLRDSPLRLVIAAGFCGALVPALRVGDVVTSQRVSLLTSPLLAPAPRELCGSTTRCAGAESGEIKGSARIVTVDHLVTDPAEKRRLGELHDAVDMESAAVAKVCAGQGVPFLAVRAVSDTVDTALSPELVRLLSGGKVSALKACGALVRKPTLAGEFWRLARDTKLAARKLAEALVAVIEEAQRR